MADNKQAGAAVGLGPTFATDEIGGIDYPRAKMVWGADGTATDVSAAAPIPVVQTGAPALPTGAATEATLAAESAKLPATLGQKAMAASMAVALASDQTVIPVSDNSGSLTTDTPQLAATLGQKNMAGSAAVVLASDQAAIPVTADTELPPAAALADAASATPTTPSVGAVPLLMNATTVDRQRAVVNGQDSAGTGIAAAGLVGQLDDVGTSAVTENQFAPVRISSRRALLVEGVSGGTAVPVSAAALPLPTGAATETTLSAASAKLPATLGQKAMAASMAVAIASDQGNIGVTDGGTSLTVDSAQLPATLGQKAMTASLPVVLASDQASVPVAATLAAETTKVIGTVNVAAGQTIATTNAGTFATQDSEKVVDNAAFTDGTTKVQPAGFIVDEVAGTALTENDAGAARMDSKRAQVMVIEDETTRGQRLTITAGKAMKTDGSGVTQPVSIAATVTVTDVPATSGGWTPSKTISAATTNATSVKASAGQVGGWYLYNANAAVRYLKLYNKASAPTVGSDTPVLTIPIPPGSAANVEFGKGIAFATGIAFAITTGVADADTAAVAANEIVVNLLYK